jgi:hypothetical protein
MRRTVNEGLAATRSKAETDRRVGDRIIADATGPLPSWPKAAEGRPWAFLALGRQRVEPFRPSSAPLKHQP